MPLYKSIIQITAALVNYELKINLLHESPLDSKQSTNMNAEIPSNQVGRYTVCSGSKICRLAGRSTTFQYVYYQASFLTVHCRFLAHLSTKCSW